MLGICTLQVPYLVEWALFYRALQGVARVSICDHGSTDDPHLINDLFQSRGIDGVAIEPAPEVWAVTAPPRLALRSRFRSARCSVEGLTFRQHGRRSEIWSTCRGDLRPVLAFATKLPDTSSRHACCEGPEGLSLQADARASACMCS